jgi:hypothetical protein
MCSSDLYSAAEIGLPFFATALPFIKSLSDATLPSAIGNRTPLSDDDRKWLIPAEIAALRSKSLLTATPTCAVFNVFSRRALLFGVGLVKMGNEAE